MTKSALGRIHLHGMQLPTMANFTEVAVSTIDFTVFTFITGHEKCLVSLYFS